MKRKPRVQSAGPGAGTRGFTAIEIAMVATVIAILALIVLPLFRNRVEEAKIAATKADLASLQKAETLAQADTGYFLRLEDLDNTQGNPYNSTTSQPPSTGIVLETPPFVYPPGPSANRKPLTLNEWRNLAGTETTPKFKGPYTSFQRAMRYADLKASPLAAYILRSNLGTNKDKAAIWDIPQADAPSAGLYDSEENRVPIDPWGNPYLFFPASGETLYTNSAIYSLGPDGLPGKAYSGSDPAHYLRPDPTQFASTPNDWLGGGDDIMVQF